MTTPTTRDRRPLPDWVHNAPRWAKPRSCPECGPDTHFINRWSDGLSDADWGVPPQWQCWRCGQVMIYPFREGEEPNDGTGVIS